MPTATPTMPLSEMGASNTRELPYLVCKPSVQRNTPPKYPTSWPNTTTLSSRSSITSMAERRAWIMVMVVVVMAVSSSMLLLWSFMSHPQLLTLALQVLRHLFIDVLEHGRGAWNLATGEGAVLFGFLLRLDHFGFKFGTDRRVFLFGPLANLDQVLLEAGNRIAQREVAPVVGGTVLGWVIGGGVWAGAVGDPLDQGGPQVAARTLGGPGRGEIGRASCRERG